MSFKDSILIYLYAFSRRILIEVDILNVSQKDKKRTKKERFRVPKCVMKFEQKR